MVRRLFIGLGLSLAVVAVAVLVVAFLRTSARRVDRDLLEARQALAEGKDRDAAERFERYRSVAGSAADPDALVERAMLALHLASLPGAPPRDVNHAVNAAFDAIRRRPDDLRLRRRLAEVQISRRDFAGAREHLLVIRESIGAGTPDLDPATTDLCLARTWLGTGDHQQALAIVAKLTGFDADARAFDDDPPDVVAASDAYLLLAEILRENLDDPVAAAAAVERCVEAHPDDPAALVAYSRLTSSRDDVEAALEAAARAASVAPDDAEAVLAHTQALAATGDNKAACAASLDGVRRMPANRPLFASAARLVAVHGEPEEILEILDACWERLGHQEYAVLVFLANMRIDWKSRGAIAERLAAAREKLGQDNPAVIVLESRVRMAEGEWTAAEKALVKARAIVPKEAKRRIDDLLARCLVSLGDADEAIVIFRRLEREPRNWWGATSGLAESHLDLGQTEAAAKFVDKLCRRWVENDMAEQADKRVWLVAPTLSPMIRVMSARPAGVRDWTPIESIVESLAESRPGTTDGRIIAAQVALLVAQGDFDRAESVVPPWTESSPTPQFDPPRISLVGHRDGVVAMRDALAALPGWRRGADVLRAAFRTEATQASGDDRGWLRFYAAASDDIGSATEAVQILQELARLAIAAGWADESRALWERAAARAPGDFRPHLALAIDAAGRSDSEAAAAAASRVAMIEGADSPRGRVASAAAIIAEVRRERGERPSRPGGPNDVQARRLQEAKSLLREAGNDRDRWQTVSVLLAEIDSLEGNWLAAAGHLQRALEDGPTDPRLVFDLATTLDRSLRLGDAERYRDSVAPAGVGGGDRLAIDASLRAEDDLSAAERSLVAIDAETADLPTLLWLSRLCSRAGLQDQASDVATKATRFAPSNPDAWLRLVQCRLAESNRSAADAALAEGCDAVPPERRLQLKARGDAAFGRTAEADRGFRAAIEEGDDDPATAALFVDFLIRTGRTRDAERVLKELISGRFGERFVTENWALTRMQTLRDAPSGK